jgi:tRNA-dihydrouridine synthase
MRILPTIEETLKIAKLMVECGCSLLTVHGRTKEEIGQYQGSSN